MSTRRRTITVTPRGSTFVMTGYQVAELARHAGLRPVYVGGTSCGWVADVTRLPDLLAFFDSQHIGYTLQTDPGEHHEDLEARGVTGQRVGQSDQLDPPDGDQHDLFGGEVA